jgi:hypothetical protein
MLSLGTGSYWWSPELSRAVHSALRCLSSLRYIRDAGCLRFRGSDLPSRDGRNGCFPYWKCRRQFGREWTIVGNSLKQSEDISFPQDRNSFLSLSVSDINRVEIHISFILGLRVFRYWQTYGFHNRGISSWAPITWWARLSVKTKFVWGERNLQ